MNMTGNELKKSILAASSVRIQKDNVISYNFKHYAFGERGTFIRPELVKEITESLSESVRNNFGDFDYIVSPEPGGHTWGMLTAYFLNKPINILRMNSKPYEEFEVHMLRETAYNENYIHFDSFQAGDKILLLDDVISSGSTLKGIIRCRRDSVNELRAIMPTITRFKGKRIIFYSLGISGTIKSAVKKFIKPKNQD